jgi:hypothetical protein
MDHYRAITKIHENMPFASLINYVTEMKILKYQYLLLILFMFIVFCTGIVEIYYNLYWYC